MADTAPQNYSNHARFVPLFHFVTFGILVLNVLWAGYKLVRFFSFDAVMALLVAVALVLLFFFCRIFPLTAQDRVIRLEERLRLARLLPADQQARIEELRPRQLVALRFASDAELPGLVARVLAGELTDPKAIKQAIQNWRADHLRV
ncbi:MAG: DUF6526 family protein [Thermoanaerobaculia bacterium]|nr:DUF6526 family protein [Thermoanaerobaculia bacterium]